MATKREQAFEEIKAVLNRVEGDTNGVSKEDFLALLDDVIEEATIRRDMLSEMGA